MEAPKKHLPLVTALPLLAAGVVWAWGGAWGDPASAVEARFLALLVAGVGTAVAVLATRPGWEVLATALGAPLAALAVTPGPARGAAVLAVLTLALAVAAARALPRALTSAGEALDPRRIAAVLLPLAIGLQLIARGSLLLAPPGLVRTSVVLLALPVVAGLAGTELVRTAGAARGLAAAAAAFALGGGWWPGNVLALGVLALGWCYRPASVPAEWLRRTALLGGLALLAYLAPRLGALSLGVGLLALVLPLLGSRVADLAGALAFVVALAAAYPWHRPQPLAALAAIPRLALGAIPRLSLGSGEAVVGNYAPVRLDRSTPHFAQTLDRPRTFSEVVVDTSLALAAGVPAGTPVATLRLFGAAGREDSFTLRVGSETGEWAARRPGVDAQAPAPLVAWIDPGRFFGQRYRARWQLDSAVAVDRLELHRRPDLPDAVEIHLFRLELVP